MADLDQIFDAGSHGHLIARGVISRAPTTVDEPAYVVIESFDEEHEYGPCPWQPRAHGFPQVGDVCVVIFDERGDPWISTWAGETDNTAGGDLSGEYPDPAWTPRVNQWLSSADGKERLYFQSGGITYIRGSGIVLRNTADVEIGEFTNTGVLRLYGVSTIEKSGAALPALTLATNGDNYANLRVIRNNSDNDDGMYLGYGRAGIVRFYSDSTADTTEKSFIAATGRLTLNASSAASIHEGDPQLWTTGDIKHSATKTADHAGWLLADGRAITAAMGFTALRADLIAAGNPHGVSGSDPRIPDLRGRAIIGAGTGSGLTARALGALVGTETHTITTAQMPSHNHGGATGGMSANDPHSHFYSDYELVVGSGAAFGANYSGQQTIKGTQTTSIAHTHSISSEGGGGAIPLMQPSLALHPFIKT